MYKTTNMIMKNPIYLLSKNNATAVIVNEEFKKLSLKHKLKGLDFVEEGYSIYTNL